MKYTIITPVKNEEEYIRYTLDSIVNQVVMPNEWIIVDDGSTDRTLSILKEYGERYRWIKVVSSSTKNEERAGGAKVIRAFNLGYSQIARHDYDFIVKLDGDLKLRETYFRDVANVFKSQPEVGICGGYLLNKFDDKLVQEIKIDYHVRGAFKSVRRECFEQIGGFKEIWNWDGMDQMEAFRLGWKSKIINSPVIHYRPTSSAYNPVKFQFKCGWFAYKLRNNFVLTLLRSVGRARQNPFFVSTFLYLGGYFFSFLNGEEKIIEKELGKYTNEYHIKRILSRLLNTKRDSRDKIR